MGGVKSITMAKVRGALLSQTATGTVAGHITFEKRGGAQYVYEKKRGSGGVFLGALAGYGQNLEGASVFGYSGRLSRLGSALQPVRKLFFLSGWGAYAVLSPSEKVILSSEARALRVSGANLFMRRWLETSGI